MQKKYKGAELKEVITSRKLKTRSQMTTTVRTDVLNLMKEYAVEHNVRLSRLVDEAFLMFLREYEADEQVTKIEL